MKCPYCGDNTPDAWKVLIVSCPTLAASASAVVDPDVLANKVLTDPDQHQIQLDWMYCAAEGCKQLVIRVQESLWRERIPGTNQWVTDIWNARPRHGAVRPIEGPLPPHYRRDFVEAVAIVELSPRMSAVLARKIVFDLLEEYAKITEYTLKASLDKFIADTSYPSRIRTHLQHLREIGDFGAHTKKDDLGQIIEVTRDDAEWTLDLVERLFEYFIFDPDRDQQLASRWDKNLEEAGRKPIPPVPPDPEVPSS
jgi:hypothetical protein